ncbi:MAG: helix-turn-helix transcriptional regulator [Candidatus Limnocylindria bacterium]
MGDDSFEEQLATLALLLEPTRRALYRYVERQPRSVSRDEAADALGISRALAAFHLDRLVAARLLKVEYRRLSGRSGPGAGRTSKLYRRSRHEFVVTLPDRNHELLARLLVESAPSGSGSITESEPARELGASLGARARKRIRGRVPAERLQRCVRDVLETLGFDPYEASDEIRLRNCPFDPLSRVSPAVVCGVGQALAKGVVEGIGAGHLRVFREEHPDRCCGVVAALANPAAG